MAYKAYVYCAYYLMEWAPDGRSNWRILRVYPSHADCRYRIRQLNLTNPDRIFEVWEEEDYRKWARLPYHFGEGMYGG